MVHAIEFHGRLCRSDGRPANPGSYTLVFRLHDTTDGPTWLWQEEVRDVAVAAGGFYHLLLGLGAPLRAQLFGDGPKFLSVSIVRAGHVAEETADRVPLLGSVLQIQAALAAQEARLAALEVVEPPDYTLFRRRLLSMRRRVRRLEGGGGVIGLLIARITALEHRVGRLDAEGARVQLLEDELEDLVGPDGDVVDLNERMDALEERSMAALVERVERLEHRLAGLEPPPPSLDGVGAPKLT